MKKLTTISLFIFWAVVTALLTAGLVFYQNNKQPSVGNLIQNTINQNNLTGGSLTLNMAEIVKHNKSSDCWMLINNKVYNITSYFGSHPGGNGKMAATCGKDATVAYKTQDPNAVSSGSYSAHSSNAVSLLANYYIGDLNQTIGGNKIIETNNIVAPKTRGSDDEDD
jgi:cytochrome b involved in lipid metabolism